MVHTRYIGITDLVCSPRATNFAIRALFLLLDPESGSEPSLEFVIIGDKYPKVRFAKKP